MRFYLISLSFLFAGTVSANSLDHPGDMLSTGQQTVINEVSVSDWYASGEYIDNAEKDFSEVFDRGIADARKKGYGFTTLVNYWLGVSRDLNLGVRYGYAYDKYDVEVSGNDAVAYNGEWKNEGGTDIDLMAKYRYNDISVFEAEVRIPGCQGTSRGVLCSSKLGRPGNSEQSSVSGGQGQGHFSMKLGMAANWITPMETHWAARAYVEGGISDEVGNAKVQTPIRIGGSFAAIFNENTEHHWMLSLNLMRQHNYDVYSEQVQQEVDFGSASRLSIRGDYFWDVMPILQVRPFAEFAIEQHPNASFDKDGVARRFEYSGGSHVKLGAQLVAHF
ncbi:hypothetical protein HF888_00080 [Bermanella marisrubri]|uniref:Porin n=1 Tax=Bermanella marisrubri TaxID=207949 RepID=Q1MZ83_9GAMM|nr:hypothetical protein [Bermanella marisrubri]EAT11250.1 hypothetical protein RED65_08339 [Oceanobacter sp. RED65] [Bermanella marisrubri]QIZ82733.1 hypothetical protein HF888_00080 [Bermanella marisrubri]